MMKFLMTMVALVSLVGCTTGLPHAGVAVVDISYVGIYAGVGPTGQVNAGIGLKKVRLFYVPQTTSTGNTGEGDAIIRSDYGGNTDAPSVLAYNEATASASAGVSLGLGDGTAVGAPARMIACGMMNKAGGTKHDCTQPQ